MLLYLFLTFLAVNNVFSAPAGELEAPSNVANRSIAIKGTLYCGKKPFEGAKIRLFRVYQKNKVDDLAHLLDAKQTYITGMFQVEGNTARFPKNSKVAANKGYLRWSVHLPADYVTVGTKARKVYDFGRINLELQFPGEAHDKKFNIAE
ncbi:unnamed protein product [Caenorhabditis auriculariae]|uniref:Arrestin-like N-terminal domain-containing protein n=1 Tax=Caenorhabditis auriculariae TaxID=2777116 RepID=A0A8S1GP01_9PELO|nr:unnamed protein product [Caenorhabditis auriculariae]